MPVLTLPLALLGLAGLPAVGAVYWLRSRSRRHPVSSLMLWADQRRTGQAGRIFERMELPLLLFLELLAVAMLSVAAAGPRLARPDARAALIVVLDDSYSMLAGDVRARAAAKLTDLLAREPFRSVQLVAAGTLPRVLGWEGSSAPEALAGLDQWTCQSPWSDLDRAVGLAGAMGGPWAKILVLTDQAPPAPPAGRVRWLALGGPTPNVAIVNAVRSARDGADRCLLEVANLSDQPASARLTLQNSAESSQALELAPRSRQRVLVDCPSADLPLRASLGADALAIDNAVTLLPAGTQPVRVQVSMADAGLAGLASRACQATGRAVLTADAPELVITDSMDPAAPRTDEAWTLHLVRPAKPAAFVGPFVLDHAHPLVEGLGLEGVVWSGGEGGQLPGRPVVSAGNVPLLSDLEQPGGSRRLWLTMSAEYSTVQNTPNWPVLFQNLLSWRRSASQRLGCVNARLGQTVRLNPPPLVRQARLVRPDGGAVELTLRGGPGAIQAEQVGIYQVSVGGEGLRLAVNALSADESDLSNCQSGDWGDWMSPASLQNEYVSIAWVFLLAAAGVLGLHATLVSRQHRGVGP